jgi:hypothetical protein
MQAFYSFCRELREITDGEASPTLKLTLLGDWRAEIASLYASRPQHLVTGALRDAIESFDLCCRDFLAVIDGMAMNSRLDIRAPSLEQLDFYDEQRAVATIRIALRILAAAPPGLRARRSDARSRHAVYRHPARSRPRRRPAAPLPAARTAAGRGHLRDDAELRIGATGAAAGLQRPCRASGGIFCGCRTHDPSGSSWAMLATTAVLGSYRALLKALLARGWARIDTSRSTFRPGAKQHCCSVTVSLPADQRMTGIADVTGSLPH